LAISRHASPRGGFLFEIRFPTRAHWQINRGGFTEETSIQMITLVAHPGFKREMVL
jgi:hypothetical protein